MLGLQISPKRWWHLAGEGGHVTLDFQRLLRSQHDADHGGMTEGEMQRRGWQSNAMGITDALDFCHLFQNVRGCVLIIVFSASNGAGCSSSE